MKWQNIYDYLIYKVEDWDITRMKTEFLELAQAADSDTLQDLYQADMENDSFFEELTE